MSSNIVVSIIIPTLNESSTISRVIKSIPLFKLPPTEVIVVDGNSDDNTRKLAEQAGARVILEHKRGYGRALLKGMNEAKGKVFVWMDGDGTYPPAYIPDLIRPLLDQTADVAIGSRIRGTIHEGAMPALNRFGNLMLTLLFNFLFIQRISDTQCGLRALSRRGYQQLHLNANGMPLASQMLTQAARARLPIVEVPIAYFPRTGDSKLVPIKDGWLIFKTLIKETFKKKK